MRYFLMIEHKNSYPTYINDIKSWRDITDYLLNKLDKWTIRVVITKYSSDNRLLGKVCVTMDNLIKVVTSLSDKTILKTQCKKYALAYSIKQRFLTKI